MINRGKHNVLGIQMDAVNYEAAVARIIDAARAHQGAAVSALAVHGLMIGVLDPVQRYRLNRFPEVMECMIKHWRMLAVLGDTKPRVPKLGLLPNVLHEVFDIMSANHTELVQQITKPDFTEALDSYINEMMKG